MKTQDKEAWIGRQHLRAGLAISAIEAARKQKCSDYDERTRKLNKFISLLESKTRDAQDELFDENEMLSKEIEALLSAPLRGLE